MFIELGANDDQLEFPVIYASAKDGYASHNPDDRSGDMRPLLKKLSVKFSRLRAMLTIRFSVFSQAWIMMIILDV